MELINNCPRFQNALFPCTGKIWPLKFPSITNYCGGDRSFRCQDTKHPRNDVGPKQTRNECEHPLKAFLFPLLQPFLSGVGGYTAGTVSCSAIPREVAKCRFLLGLETEKLIVPLLQLPTHVDNSSLLPDSWHGPPDELVPESCLYSTSAPSISYPTNPADTRAR